MELHCCTNMAAISTKTTKNNQKPVARWYLFSTNTDNNTFYYTDPIYLNYENIHIIKLLWANSLLFSHFLQILHLFLYMELLTQIFFTIFILIGHLSILHLILTSTILRNKICHLRGCFRLVYLLSMISSNL